jgi:hypothetical protein
MAAIKVALASYLRVLPERFEKAVSGWGGIRRGFPNHLRG